MHLLSLSSAFPAHRFTQAQSHAALTTTSAHASLRSGSQALLEKLLTRPGAIDARHFATHDIAGLVQADPGELNSYFEIEGTRLAKQALEKALQQAGLSAPELDALILCTCTGYLCPGLTSHVAEQLDMRPDTYLQDIVGLGCGAAIPTLRAANGYLAAHPGAKVAVIAVEICSAAFYMDDDPGVLISLCLFGDGASASIWSDQHTSSGNSPVLGGFDTYHLPQHREKLRFENQRGFLRNLLHREVPTLASSAVDYLFNKHQQSSAIPVDLASITSHGGGRDVLDAIESRLGPNSAPGLSASRHVLRNYGNLSSPSVLLALQHRLEDNQKSSLNNQQSYWLTSFGAGFAAHSCQLNL